jgi:hypothetical protein
MYPVRRTFALAVAGLVAASGGTATALAAGHSAAHGHAHAVAEANSLLTHAPTAPNEVRSSTAPVKRLATAPQSPETQIVSRAKYWTIDEPYRQVEHDLTASTPNGFTKGGTSIVSGPHYRELFTAYYPNALPTGIAYAALTVVVTPTGGSTTAVGVYGQAVPQPKRAARENVPTSVHKVVVSKVSSSSDTHPLQRTITGRRARALVASFNAMQVQPPGVFNCPESHGQEKTATFTANGNTWVASIDACNLTQVVRDGQALPDLSTSTRFSNELTRATRTHRPKHS